MQFREPISHEHGREEVISAIPGKSLTPAGITGLLRLIVAALLLGFSPAGLAELKIEVTGVGSNLARNIRNHIGEPSERERQVPRLLKRRLDSAVRKATEAMGFYGSEYRYTLDGDTLTIEVTVGKAVYWAPPSIMVSDAALAIPALQDLVEDHPFKPSRRLQHQTYESYKRQLLQQLQEHGFLDARFRENRLVIDLELLQATAVLHMEAGRRYHVTEINFSGTALEEKLLFRLSPIQPGDGYHRSKVTELQRNLQNSLYFRSVDVQTETRGDHDAILNVTLDDASRHEIAVGLGFGTDTGPRARLRWERPRVNRFGHRLTSEARVSAPRQEITGVYSIPLRYPLYQNLSFSSGWERRDLEDTESSIGRVGVNISDRIFNKKWVVNYGINFEHESFRQGSEDRQRVSYFIPGTSLSRMEISPGVDPLRGYRTSFTLAGSHPSLGADSAFVRVTAGHKRLIHLGRNHLLIARAEVGTITTDDIQTIPASQRFFTGGDQTVRGFGFESISSVDDEGKLIGGKHLNIASLEYSLKIAERWRFAVFTDSGRAFNNFSEDWRNSAGFGVRWLSPVGQIRIDLAFPIDDDDKSGFRLHVFMGPPL